MSKSNNEIKLTDQQIEYIARYISKEPSELSEIQKIQVEKWRKEIPFFENEFQNYSKLWQESNRFGQKLGQNYSPNVEKGWQKLSQQIKEYEANKTVAKEWVKPAIIPQTTAKSISISKSIWKEIGKIAAILIIGLGLGWWINSTQNNSNLSDSTQIIVHQHSNTPLVLPDGSKIWLNKNATISYNSDFGKFESSNKNIQKRNLKLNGEAFFDIARDEKHPFTIDVEGKAEVEVLGTSFNINPSNEKIEVTVTSGKVNFTTNIPSKENVKTNMITLVKGEKGILYKNDESRPDSLPSLVRFERNDDVNYLAWLNHRLVFENMQMQEVVSKVEMYYNIRLKLENSSLKECRFTGTFDQTPLNDVLETLSFGANLQIKKSDSTTYLLSGSGCR